VARNPYKKQSYKPHKSTVKSLKFTRVYRCNGQGCGIIHKNKAPAQCHCGSISFDHFHSDVEARYYALLLLLESRGKISNLKKQVRFPLHTQGPDGLKIKVCDYIADFEHDDENGKRVVTEVKGGMTEVASLKIKWFEAEYGIKLYITKGC